jgi:hypothetical protein
MKPKTIDPRDLSPEPPAYLDPYWALTMRRRLIEFASTGNLDWYPAPKEKKP